MNLRHGCNKVIVVSLTLLFSVLAHPSRNANDFRKVFIADPDTRVRTFELMPAIVILARFSDRRATLSSSKIRDVFFGHDPSVAGYFRAASRSSFTLVAAEFRRTRHAVNPGVFGWYDLGMTRDQFDSLSAQKRRAVTIQAAAKDMEKRLDYESLDRNKDDVIDQSELSVTLVWAGCDRNAEAVRRTDPARLPIGNGFKLDQFVAANYEGALTINESCENKNISPNRMVHALGHTLFGLGDQYPGTTPGQTEGLCSHSVMSSDWALVENDGVPHLDPWALLQLGWSKARVATGGNDGKTCYQLTAVEHSGQVLIVPIFGRGTQEYFLVENRFPAGSYQAGYKPGAQGVDRGLAIWHIDESIVNNPNRPPDPLGRKSTINHRQAIRLLRAAGPVPGGACSGVRDRNALFDITEPQHGYAVTDNSTPRNSRTRDNKKTGIQIMPVSEPGREMMVKVQNPYDVIHFGRIRLQNRIDALIAERDNLLNVHPATEEINQRIDGINRAAADLIRQRNRLPRNTVNSFSSIQPVASCS